MKYKGTKFDFEDLKYETKIMNQIDDQGWSYIPTIGKYALMIETAVVLISRMMIERES